MHPEMEEKCQKNDINSSQVDDEDGPKLKAGTYNARSELHKSYCVYRSRKPLKKLLLIVGMAAAYISGHVLIEAILPKLETYFNKGLKKNDWL